MEIRRYLNEDWKILYQGGIRGKIYWQWVDMLKPELYDVLYDLLNEKCKRGKWKIHEKIFREPKRSIIIDENGEPEEIKDGIQLEAHPSYTWKDFPIIKDIGNMIYKEFGLDEDFDYCLVNIYDDGKDGIGWHSDREAGDSDIMSVSLGCTRDFAFRSIYKTNNGGRCKPFKLDNINSTSLNCPSGPNGRIIYKSEFVEKLPLESGDVVYMKKGCQKVLKHTLCKTSSKKKIITPRINLTYRKY